MLAEPAAAVREQRVTAVELVGLARDRIQRLNPALNVVTVVREEALQDPHARRRRRGRRA